MTLNPLKGSTEITVWKCQPLPASPSFSLRLRSFSSLPLPPSQFLSAERCWQPRHNNLALLWNCHSGSSAVQRFPTYGARAKQGVTSRRCHWTVPLQGGGGTGNYLQQSTMQSCLTTPVQNVVTFSISQLRGSSRDREEGKGHLKSEV